MNSRKIKIKDICTINRSTIDRKKPPESIYYLDTGNITRNEIDEFKYLKNHKDKYPSRAQRLVKHNTIVYSTVRPNQEHFGIIKKPRENLIVSTGFATLDITDSEIDPRYLYYSLTRNDITKHLHRIGQIGVTSYPSISPGDLGAVQLQIPKKKEVQSKIAKIISDLDAKIVLNKKINEELEAMAKLIYDYWFVQFDFPDDNGKSYKSSGGKMVFNEALNREIPEGWEVGSLTDIADYINGIACQKYPPIENKDYLRVIKIREMRDGFTENSDLVSTKVPEKIKISDGNILFSWSASLEVMIWTGGKGVLNQHIFKVTSEKYPKSFYFFEIVNYLNHFKMMADLRKTTMGHITKGHLEQSRIAIPPLEKVQELDKILKPYFKLIVKNDQENKRLESLRDWLLPMLMNGHVTVSEAEQKMSVAAEPEVEYEPAKKPTNVDYYKRTALAAEIVWQLHKQPTLGHVKLQKLIYLSQETSNMNLPTNFLQQAAGPYDPRMARSIEKQLKKKQWFEFKEGEFLKFKPLEKAGEHRADFDKYFHKEKANIHLLIGTFGKAKTEKVEIVATLYACWRELFKNSEPASEERLIEKFYGWSKEKAKFKEERLRKAIGWMEKKGIKPG